MIRSIHFDNLRALRDTTLPLSPFTVLLGPNGSGKSTVLLALEAIKTPQQHSFQSLATIALENTQDAAVKLAVDWQGPYGGANVEFSWPKSGQPSGPFAPGSGRPADPTTVLFASWLTRLRTYSLDARAIAQPVQISPGPEMQPNGANLAGVLDFVHDEQPERFEALNQEVARWLPEYDRILPKTTGPGQKSYFLRTRKGKHAIPAALLSQGTLLALAMLTLAYLPEPPSFIGLEEPDRGIHPRLLRELRDALYRLSYPQNYGEKRDPVQVLITTHSPYLLDLYRDHPEEVVLAEKVGLDVRFQRLSDIPHVNEILGDAPLSEVWYSGIVGGAAVQP